MTKQIHDITSKIMDESIFLTLKHNEEIFIYKGGVYTKIAESHIKERAEELLGDESNTHRINEVVNCIKRKTYKDGNDLKQSVELICLNNGILNIETKELVPHDPNKIFFNKLDITYNPNASYKKFEEFVIELTNTFDVYTIKQFIGYCLRRDTIYQKALLLYGKGKNGKSTLCNIIQRFIGKDNISNIPLQQLDMDKFMAAKLDGCMLNVFADIPKSGLYETAIIKSAITGETMIVQNKFGHPYNTKLFSKFIFSCNKIPETHDHSSGFYRRWIIIEFLKEYQGDNLVLDKEKEFMDEESMSGILNWALNGLEELKMSNGFLVTEEQTREFWSRNSDNVSAFIEDKIILDVNGFIVKENLYNIYKEYCNKNKRTHLVLTEFCKKIKKKLDLDDYQPTINGKQEHAWKGIRLKE